MQLVYTFVLFVATSFGALGRVVLPGAKEAGLVSSEIEDAIVTKENVNL